MKNTKVFEIWTYTCTDMETLVTLLKLNVCILNNNNNVTKEKIGINPDTYHESKTKSDINTIFPLFSLSLSFLFYPTI